MMLLATESISVSIAGKQVVRDLSFSVAPGQCWGILGANGVGKTTLLHTLAGLRELDAGHIELAGKHLDKLSRRQIAQRLGIVPQHSFDQFGASVRETILMGRHPHIAPFRGETSEDLHCAQDAMQQFDLLGLADSRVDQLSAGERRRVAVATLFCQAPKVWLLDEPTNHLDLHHQFELLGTVVDRVTAANSCLITILHDANLVSRFCTHSMLLFGDGEIRTGRTEELLTRENLGRLYGRPVIDSIIEGRRVFVPA